ncbi:MAG TPA: CotH kinase family protein [Cytophagaceae bacterium]|jgi:hypothetical protein
MKINLPFVFCTLLLSTLFFVCQAQVIVNEICTNNSARLPDNKGNNHDWIELYNTGTTSVNLTNYKLSDDPLRPTRWSFPNVVIGPKEYLTVFASGTSNTDKIDHWETIVKEGDTWRYKTIKEFVRGWTTLSFSDLSWAQGKGGLGFGDSDDATAIASGTINLYMRRVFSVIDTAAIQNAILDIDYDDGFIAYLNGVEIARDNVSGKSPTFWTTANSEHEADMYKGIAPTRFELDMAAIKANLIQGDNVLALEIHNVSDKSDDLSARVFLSFGINNSSVNYSPVQSWFIPPSQNLYIHTNFSLDEKGETIVFSDPSGNIINKTTVPYLNAGNTYGRFPNLGENWSHLSTPTPNESNSTSFGFKGYSSDSVQFSLAAGFYAGSQTLSISGKDLGSMIRYTTDGSKPDSTSTLYTTPINIAATQVIRAGIFKPGYIPQIFEANTYFIADGATLPIFSISTAPDNFFSPSTGIYSNFNMDWEREVHVEYFDKNRQLGFEQDMGVEIFGTGSKSEAMKSLALMAKGKYGKKKITYPLFSKKKISEFEEIVLRNSGNDFNNSNLRDALNATVIGDKTNLDFLAYEPVLVYINGAFWGFHSLREKVNEDYLKGNHGYDKGQFDLLENNGGVIEGNDNQFYDMVSFVKNNDLTATANYTKVKSMLDIENFVDYFAVETYHLNLDWPFGNVKYWKPTTEGRWRYIYLDTDFSLGLELLLDNGQIYPYNKVSDNELKRVLETPKVVHVDLLNKLLTNTEFKNYFINRYADLMNTIYLPTNYKGILNGFRDEMSPNMVRHYTKWPQKYGSIGLWGSELSKMRTFIDGRPAYARAHILKQFALTKQVNVTLDVSPQGAGKIKISSIIPETLPWTGVYFDGVPVTITAIPNDGFEFSSWTSTNLITTPNTNKSITLNISSTDKFTAQFITVPLLPKVTISEINYRSSPDKDAGDWIELHNSGKGGADLSGWVLRDGTMYNSYTLPTGTQLSAGAFLVLSSNLEKFKSIYPNVKNVIGGFGFGLKSSGETLQLIDNTGKLRLSMKYLDAAPWPLLADDKGQTLELKDYNGDITNPSSWFDGCEGGSPGRAYEVCSLGLREIAINHVKVFPNPFNSSTELVVNYEVKKPIKIKITDLSGKDFFSSSETFFTNEQITLGAQLNSGIYLLHVEFDNMSRVMKLIKFK